MPGAGNCSAFLRQKGSQIIHNKGFAAAAEVYGAKKTEVEKPADLKDVLKKLSVMGKEILKSETLKVPKHRFKPQAKAAL